MAPEKTRRVLSAAGFLAGVLASLDALRDTKVYWPPDVVWNQLLGKQRFELGIGLVLIIIAVVASALQGRAA